MNSTNEQAKTKQTNRKTRTKKAVNAERAFASTAEGQVTLDGQVSGRNQTGFDSQSAVVSPAILSPSLAASPATTAHLSSSRRGGFLSILADSTVKKKKGLKSSVVFPQLPPTFVCFQGLGECFLPGYESERIHYFLDRVARMKKNARFLKRPFDKSITNIEFSCCFTQRATLASSTDSIKPFYNIMTASFYWLKNK